MNSLIVATISPLRKRLFYVVTALYWFSMYTYVPILSPYVRHVGGSIAMAGIVIASYGFTQMLIRIPLGIWSDKLGTRRWFVIAGVVCSTLSSLGFATTSGLWPVLGFRALAGVAAASWVAFTVLFASYFSREEAPKALGLISFYTSIGQMVATTLGGGFAQWYGWHAPFWLGTVGGAIGIVLSLTVVDTPADPDRKPIAVRELLALGGHRTLLLPSLLAVFAQVLTFTTMFGFTPLHAVQIGATSGELGILTLCTTLPNAVAGYVSGGVLVRRWGSARILVFGFAMSALCTLAVPLTHSFAALLVTQMVNGFAQGLLVPILMSLAIRSVSDAKRATAMGFFQAIYSLGMFGGPFVTGWVGQVMGLTGIFVVSSIVGAIGAVCVPWWLSTKRQKTQGGADECQAGV